ncbi:hypothetical protein [Paraburkholderia nodosa]|uniref:hypothetical protein n=1 Tax=Paraburkholderia nodosa TaxID=392320 RepID=UPI0012B68743|nr:hypothetical protein [Paraburkholderia nodosa]
MCNVLRLGPALLAGLVCSAPVAAQTYEGQPIDSSTCRDVTGQTEIDGIIQPYTGRACRQPDGNWVFVNGYGPSWVMPDYAYNYEPWYFGPPVFLSGGFVFFDDFHRHHHHHHFDHDHFGHLFERDFDRDRFDHRPNRIVTMPSTVPPAQPPHRLPMPPAPAPAPHVVVMPPKAPAQAPHIAVTRPGVPAQAPHVAAMPPSAPAQSPHMAVMQPRAPAQAGHTWTGGYGGVGEGGHASGGGGGHFTGRGFGGGTHGH